MKKFLMLLCVFTCIFGLTACGEEKPLSDLDQSKINNCMTIANSTVQFAQFGLSEDAINQLTTNYNTYEMKELFQSIMYQNTGYQITADYGVLESIISSYTSSLESMGSITSIGEFKSTVTKDEITLTADVIGANRNGSVEMIFSNDIFTVLKSCTFNVTNTFGEGMEKAGLNTLLGMGTVFIVLILISCIIATFGVLGKSKKKETTKQEVKDVVFEESEELADDSELVAVIAAAIRAYEGNSSTDGFVVRSIKRANRRN